ncbi:MAG: hypothetical protein PsegKO_19470 [Pseudohongiellaceae bacterium]|jgi:quinol monooxygenase YgiN
MSDYCTFRVENGITIAHFTKAPDIDAVEAILRELAENYPQDLRLWDMRDIVINQTQDELRQVAAHSATTFANPGRIALVASDDLTYGVLRIFEVYNEQETVQSQTRVFRSMEDATRWLLEE